MPGCVFKATVCSLGDVPRLHHSYISSPTYLEWYIVHYHISLDCCVCVHVCT